MPISNDHETKLNRMNRASQNVNLGTILKQLDNVVNSGSPINALQFNLNYSGDHAEGSMNWNSEDGVPEIGMPGGNVVQQIGTEILTKVVNKTGSLIPNGCIVYGNGAQGNRLTVAPAISSNNAISNAVIGMMTEDVAHNSSGYVTLVGLVRSLDTHLFTEGQVVYLSSTESGCMVTNPPLSPNTVIGIGIVTVSNTNDGVIAVSPRILSISASRIILKDIDGYFDSTNLEDAFTEIMSGSVVFDTINISGSSGSPLLNVFQNGSGSVVKIGSENDFLSVNNHGEIRLTGSAVVWEDLRYPASGINPPGGLSDAAKDTSDTPFIGTFLFDPSSIEICAGQAQMPHGWKEGSFVHPHIHWSPTSTSTGSIVWQLDCSLANVGEAYSGSYTYTSAISVYADGTLNEHNASNFSVLEMSDKILSTIILWRISRVGSSGSDTYPQDARMLEFDIHYQMDSLGSNEEWMKNG